VFLAVRHLQLLLALYSPRKKGFIHFVILTQKKSLSRFVKTSQPTITKNDTLPMKKIIKNYKEPGLC
jgi:uncharacterized protein YpbB